MTVPARDRVEALDVARLGAAMAVVLYHYTFRGGAGAEAPVPGFQVSGLRSVFQYGYLGVDLFFVISGFVIAMSVEAVNLRRFVESRVVRLYPAYWFSVAVISIVLYVAARDSAPSLRDFLVNLTMLQEFVHIPNMDGAYWSLTVELKFYALVALWLVVSGRRHELWLGTWLLGCIVLTFVRGHLPFHLGGLRLVLFPEWAPYFIAGAFFYRWFREGRSLIRIGAVVVCCALALVNAIRRIPDLEQWFATPFDRRIIIAVTMAIFGLFVLIAEQKVHRRGARVARFAAITYPLYVLHQRLAYVVLARIRFIGTWIPFLVVLVGAVFFAWVAQRFVERPTASALRSQFSRLGFRARSAAEVTKAER